MPMTSIIGKGGSGKTTIAVYMLAKYFRDIQKYVNFNIDLPKTKILDFMDILELEETDEITIACYDEAYVELDNRLSFSDENIINRYPLFQARKNNMSIVAITQIENIDLTFRRLEDVIIFCKDRPIFTKDFKDYKGDFHYIFSNRRNLKNFTMPYNTAKKIFPLFDTKQKIMPKRLIEIKEKIKMKDPKERNKIIDKIVNDIMSECKMPENKKDITHVFVKNCMLDLEMNLTFEPFVYIRLRNKL